MIRRRHALAVLLAASLFLSNLGTYFIKRPTLLADTAPSAEEPPIFEGDNTIPTDEDDSSAESEPSGSESEEASSETVSAPSDDGIKIDETNFPDSVFRKYVTQKYDLDSDGVLSEYEADIRSISVDEMGIQSLQGIEFFPNLERLFFSRNEVSSIDISKNPKLTHITCSRNKLTSLDVSKNTVLEGLYISENQITSLDVSMLPELRMLICSKNKLSSIDVSKNTKLRDLGIDGNAISSIDVSNNLDLDSLSCGRNKITSLDISRNTKLTSLSCNENPINSLDIHANTKLRSLNCSDCSLSSIDLSKHTDLQYVYVSNNHLSSLEVSKSINLSYLECYQNELKSLDVSNLTHLYCLLTHNNQIDTLDVSNSASLVSAIKFARIKDMGSYYGICDPDKGDIILSFDKATNIKPEIKKTTPTPTTDPEPLPTAIPSPGPNKGFEGFVERLYKIALNREPEAEGKAFWVNHVVNEGATGADCARFFLLDAPEFMNRGLNNDQFVDTLYAVFFDRAAESGGKSYWVGQLNKGVSKRDVVNGFIESTEWCNVCAGYGVKSGALYHKATKPSDNALSFVSRLYAYCLNRAPEEKGLQYWSLALTNLEKTAAEAANLFFTSEEYINFKTPNYSFVNALYATFMDRNSDSAGLEYWVSQLISGVSREAIIKKFAESPEFTALCKQYGIERGTLPQPPAPTPIPGNGKIVVFGMSDEIKTIVESYLQKHPDIAAKYQFQFEIMYNDAHLYEHMLNYALENNSVDIYMAEADYAYPYINGKYASYAAPYDQLIPDFAAKLQAADPAQYVMSIGSRKSDGKICGLSYQSTPGVFIYRRSIAKQVFGSDAPDVIAKAIGANTNSWDTFLKAADQLNQKGYSIISSIGDVYNVAEKAANSPWVISGKLVIDPIRKNYMELAKTIVDKGYCNNTYAWGPDWNADMRGEGPRGVFGFFGPAWFLNYVIGMQVENTALSNDWAICESPYAFYWGGTWAMANKNVIGTEKAQIVGDILHYITLDCSKDGLQYKWAQGSLRADFKQDSVSSKSVMKMLNDKWSILNNQNPFPIFVQAASHAHAKAYSPYDNDLNGVYFDLAREYAYGEISLETALNRFKEEAKKLGIQVS